MNFTVHEISAVLENHIEAIFHYSHFIPDHSVERVVPTGHMFLIFELDGIKRHTFDNDSLEPNGSYQRVWLSGMHKNFISISAHENSEMLVVQFKSDGAYPFINRPVYEFNDVITAAEHVFGAEILQFRKRLLAEENPDDKLKLVESWLMKRFDQVKSSPLELNAVIQSFQTEPMAKHQDIIDGFPFTQKHLIEQFKKYVGLTPKYYHRIMRFNDLLLQIKQQKQVNWSDVAAQCGYTDQSHFIKEFRHFSGFNPTAYIQQDFQNNEPNFFPLDK